jgi:kynurenine formamidase
MAKHELPPEEEVLGYFTSLSNWGRWGADDGLGTLNHITPEVRRAAAAAVRIGRSVSAAWPESEIGRETQVFSDPTAGGEYADGSMVAIENIGFCFHGRDMTHLDSLAHMAWEGKTYNGHQIEEKVGVEAGATVLDVVEASNGIVTRGVLIDVPAVVPDYSPDQPVTVEMLEAAETAHGFTVRAGDAVLVRTGYAQVREANGGSSPEGARTGMDARCLAWLHERDVAVFGSDTTHDIEPFPYEAVPAPFHYVGIVAMGLWLIDNLYLEDLARVTAEVGQHDFLFTVAPLRLEGVTGSPVNPIATL